MVTGNSVLPPSCSVSSFRHLFRVNERLTRPDAYAVAIPSTSPIATVRTQTDAGT